MSDEFDPRPISKAARNERRKLLATTVNAGGVAVLALGTLTPVVTQGFVADRAFNDALSFAIFVLLHILSRRFLKGLEG